MGVSQIRPDDLEKRIDNLFQTVTIRDKNKSKRFCKISLFEKAKCYRDEDGLWQVDLGASPCAMEYIFNPERLGYLRYNLRNVVKLNSRYSYVLFLYLEQNRHMHFSLKSALLAYTRYRQMRLSMLIIPVINLLHSNHLASFFSGFSFPVHPTSRIHQRNHSSQTRNPRYCHPRFLLTVPAGS